MRIELTKYDVEQGNSNGQCILFDQLSQEVLYTQYLEGCIAILLVDQQFCYMIHNDLNKGLEEGLLNLGLDPKKDYKIGLIGGNSENALVPRQHSILG